MVHKVERDITLDFAVVAVNQRFMVMILGGHAVQCQHLVDPGVVVGHVCERLETCGTLVTCLDILLVALVMDRVAARLG
jgi:hypothetical protein